MSQLKYHHPKLANKFDFEDTLLNSKGISAVLNWGSSISQKSGEDKFLKTRSNQRLWFYCFELDSVRLILPTIMVKMRPTKLDLSIWQV